MPPTALQTTAATLLRAALIHTFAAKQFERLSSRQPRHAGLFHLFGEVGGGLTVIANAPNAAGVALLRRGFADESVGALRLLFGALAPMAVAAAVFLRLARPRPTRVSKSCGPPCRRSTPGRSG